MKSAIENIKIRCVIEPCDELIYYKMDLLDNLNNTISTLEYSDITNILKDLVEVNEQIKLYSDVSDIYTDLAQAKLNRFCNKAAGKDKIEELLNICAKYKHQNAICDSLCIYCSPHIQDVFPSFFSNSMKEDID